MGFDGDKNYYIRRFLYYNNYTIFINIIIGRNSKK